MERVVSGSVTAALIGKDISMPHLMSSNKLYTYAKI